MQDEQAVNSNDNRQMLVGAEQVRIVYEHVKPGIYATIVNALLLVFIQYNVVEHPQLFAWFGYLLLVNLIRLAIVIAYERSQPVAEEAARWGRYYVYGAGLAGAGWGLAAILLMPYGHPTQQVMTILVLAGTVAGATATQSSLFNAFKAFCFFTLVPLFVHLLIMGGLIHNILAAFTAIFTMFMFTSARRNSEILLTSLRLNYENSQLLDNLEREKRQAESLNENLKQEIAQRLGVELQLRRKEVSLEEAQRIAGLGSWEWDLDSGAVTLSTEMRRLLGFEPHNVDTTYHQCLKAIVEEDRDLVEAARRNTLALGEPYKVEYRVARPDGRFTILEEQGILRQDDRGHVLGLSAIALDITQRKEMDRIKSDFISVVSHELRTPLTSISGTLGLLRGGATGELNEKAQELVKVAERNATRLGHLVNDILDIDKLEFGGLPLKREALDLIELVRDAMEENSGYADKLGVGLNLSGHPEHLSLTGDRDRLVQVMTNLLSNAAKYSPKGETVEVSITDQGDRVRVEVSDHGPGIDPGFHDKVFQKFCQGDTSDSRVQYGTGLGLNIAKLIVERHGGEIGFDSEPGRGTTFWFTLPRTADEMAS